LKHHLDGGIRKTLTQASWCKISCLVRS
jgi:hypothetical protein